MKAIGIGIDTELSNVEVLEGENIIKIEDLQINSDTFKILTIMNDNSLISIASSNDCVPNFVDCLKEYS